MPYPGTMIFLRVRHHTPAIRGFEWPSGPVTPRPPRRTLAEVREQYVCRANGSCLPCELRDRVRPASRPRAGDEHGGVVEHEALETTASPVSALYSDSPPAFGAADAQRIATPSSGKAKNRISRQAAQLRGPVHAETDDDTHSPARHNKSPNSRTLTATAPDYGDQALQFREGD